MPTLPPSALLTEQGSSASFGADGVPESGEENGELRWPYSVAVYDRMRRTEGKLASVTRAINLPIRQTSWTLAGDEVDPRVMAFVEAELGLQRDSAGRVRRRREGISWDDFLRHALLHLYLGHMAFEQVYQPGPPPPGVEGRLPPMVLHLRKLAPRMPRTISRFDVAPDGGLVGIAQTIVEPVGQAPYQQFRSRDVFIPVEKLVLLVNEMEGADWTGTSLFRAAYRNFVMKDRLERVAGMIVERNGMGVPKVTRPATGSRLDAEKILTSLRAGEYAGVQIPEDWEVELMGVSGGTVDPLPLINYHDQAMARSALAMFLDLGHDNGARSLGDTFVDVFNQGENAVVAYIEEVVTEHVIRDLVELNFGADEPYPALHGGEISAGSALSAEALATLVKAGVLTPDSALEDDTRSRFSLPALEDATLVGAGGPEPEEDDAGLPALAPAEVAAASAPPGLADLDRRIARLRREMAARR